MMMRLKSTFHKICTEEPLRFFYDLLIGAMKADWWRYLVLSQYGGVYTDLDSICMIPIRDWPLNGPLSEKHILLLDLDENQGDFCQWTLACTPQNPAMEYVCDYILNNWKEVGLPRDDKGDIQVLEITGPKIFSCAIKEYIGESVDMLAVQITKRYFNDKSYQRKLNGLGIFFTPKKYFGGEGVENLFWGSDPDFNPSYHSWAR